ncbi:MAG: PKD domain-containing protein [Bacteroidetes bacterium]|nr:PKD domain-containing protein [Bacteroidota bacterium]
MNKWLIWGGMLLSGLTGRVHAQTHHCGTEDYYQMMLDRDPALKAREFSANMSAAQAQKGPASRAAIFTIPVVFHVVHTGGPENISREQILDQMRILNNDFNYLNWNKNKIRSQFTSVAADCQIQFKLASVDPNGACTDGINRIYSTAGIEVNMSTEEVKNLVYWDKTKYLNIWVVSSIASTQAGSTTLGYAVFPWMTNRDGVVVRSDRVGSIGTGALSDSGRTLTHEVGHWLGLYHTFQGGCGDDDLCSDTPPVFSSTTNANCPSAGNSCSTDQPDLPDQWENYMDYSDGKCMAMFTLQQKARMHAYLKTGTSFNRSNIVSANNLIATGITPGSSAPLANFVSSQTVVCAGTPVKFYDVSCKASVAARSWSFAGANISSSTDANPTVVYQTPGKYTVSLTVQNAKGSNNKSVTDYITVISRNSAGLPNVEEGFESDPSPRGYIAVSPSPAVWTTTNAVSYTGSQCFKAPVKNTDALGTVYSFRTPPLNLSSLKGGTSRISFYCAYAPAYTTSTETLRVYVSTDCGNSFVQILERSGSGLAYAGAPVTANFAPTGKSQWKLLAVPSLGSLSLDTAKYAIFKIDVISDKGNPVYLDNLNIGAWFAGLEPTGVSGITLALYPNPATDHALLQLEPVQNTRATVELLDMAGRVVTRVFDGDLQAGRQELRIPNPGASAASIYFVRVTTPGGQWTKPLTFAP